MDTGLHMSHRAAVYQTLIANNFQRSKGYSFNGGSKISTFSGNRSNTNVEHKHLSLDLWIEVELDIFTPRENVKITPYHRPIIKFSSLEFFSDN
jgi:hypothetical protein